jgi:hypothetical protein
MTESMLTLVDRLKEDHRRLLIIAGQMEAILSCDSASPTDCQRLRHLLEQFIEVLTIHQQTETQELCPALEKCLPEVDHWQIKILEPGDEAILSEAGHFLDWLVNNPTATSFGNLRIDRVRLIRWIREHIGYEEQRLLPRLL